MKKKIIEILECLFFGLLPYWCYEKKKHYAGTYYQHLKQNLIYAWWVLRNNE